MTSEVESNEEEQLATLMQLLLISNEQLKSHLLNGTVIRYQTYSIKREREIFTPIKFSGLQNAIDSLFQILASDPLNTKEAELFPGFIQISDDSFEQTLFLTSAVNTARTNIKEFLISHIKKKRVITDAGVVFTQNPLLYGYDPLINTMQVYRHLSAKQTTPVKSSFIWQSNKRYLKYDKNKALSIVHHAQMTPAPLSEDHKLWKSDLDNAYELIDRLPASQTITRICSTEPKPYFKYKTASNKSWGSHYGATPLIIACEDDQLFTVAKPIQSIDVKNKHRALPVTGNWKPLSRFLGLYY